MKYRQTVNERTLWCTHLGVNSLHYREIGFGVQPLRLFRPFLHANYVEYTRYCGSKVTVKVEVIRSHDVNMLTWGTYCEPSTGIGLYSS